MGHSKPLTDLILQKEKNKLRASVGFRGRELAKEQGGSDDHDFNVDECNRMLTVNLVEIRSG